MKVHSTLDFVTGAKITNLPVSSANGEPVVHEQLTALTGALVYQGTWNASTNSPAIPAAATGNKGQYYVVSTAGTTSINGVNDWQIGDWIVSNGTAWQKVDNTEPSASETVQGNVQLATLTEVNTGTATDKAISPKNLKDSNYVLKKYSANIGDGVALAYTVTHSLNMTDIHVQLWGASGLVMADVASVDANNITVSFAAAPAANAIRVVVLG